MAKTKIKKKVVQKKFWTFELIEYNDGTTTMTRTNKGFNIFEMLGLAELAQIELIAQLKGELPPAKIIRKVIEDA